MIVCHCNVLCCTRIKSAIESVLMEEPGRKVTAAEVYRRCQAQPDCGRCSFHISSMIDRFMSELASSNEACRGSDQAQLEAAEANAI